jgi:RecA-family ATPase
MTHPLLDGWQQRLAAVTDAEARLQVFRDAAHDIGGHIGNGIAKPDAVDELVDMALIYDFFGLDQGGIERIIGEELSSASEADREAAAEMVRRWEEQDREREAKHGGNGAAPKSEPPPLKWLDMSSWDDGPPPPLEWSITNLVPREQVGLFSGVGGTGKTTCELLKDAAHVIGLPWFNWMPTQGPVLFVGCEDNDRVWRIRLTVIAKYFNTTFADLIKGGFHLLNLFGKDATLFHHSGKSGRVETTSLYRQIYQAAGDLKPINISLDPLARIFAGNEMDRTQVYGLVAHVQALALASGGSVTLLTHPSLQGIRSGSGYSGSTAWHDAFRYRQYLRAAQEDEDEPVDPANDNGLRELTFMKNQYGPNTAKLTLRWRNGLFLPESGSGGNHLEKLAEEAKADTAFLDLLDRFAEQGRNVGPAPTSNNYAPTVFAKEGCGFNRKQLDAALRRLFAAGRIKVENYGRASHEHQRLARVGPARIPARIGPASVPHVPHQCPEGGPAPPSAYSRGERAQPDAPEGDAGPGPAAKPAIKVNVIGPCPAETPCLHCHQTGGVKRVVNASVAGGKSETLHEGCAAEWFAKL